MVPSPWQNQVKPVPCSWQTTAKESPVLARQQQLCTRGLQQPDQGHRSTSIVGGDRAAARMNFTAIAPNKKDAVVVPDGYRQAVVINWGDPVLPGAPAFDVSKQSAASQRQQFGFNNDFAGLLPIEGARTAICSSSTTNTTERFMFPATTRTTPPVNSSTPPSPRTAGGHRSGALRQRPQARDGSTTGASPATPR